MTDQTNFWYLENCNIFKALPQAILKEINQHMISCEFNKEAFIYLPEDVSETLYFLREGKVKVANYSEDGREIIKTILQPGEIFGELALFDEGKRNDFAQALDDVVACKISKKDFENFMTQYPNFSLKVNKLIGFRLLKIERRLESLAFRDARSRIIELLLDFAQEKGEKVGEEVMVKNHLTHQDIANLVATSRQTATGIMNNLRKKNLIHFDRHQILIRDLEALKKAGTEVL